MVVDWVLLTYRLPAEPSRHRVAVWRELRRVGAVSLQQATWAVPAQPQFVEAVARALDLVERAEGDALIFDAAPQGDAMAARLEALFTADREQEWLEFLAECVKFDREIDKEIRIEKFTSAELDEEEQNLERLQRWFRELRARDLFGSPSQADAERRLKECAERLDDFAQRVFEHGGGT
jgi:ChrB-like protein